MIYQADQNYWTKRNKEDKTQPTRHARWKKKGVHPHQNPKASIINPDQRTIMTHIHKHRTHKHNYWTKKHKRCTRYKKKNT